MSYWTCSAFKRARQVALAPLLALGCAPQAAPGFERYIVHQAGVSLEVPAQWRRFGARWNGLGGAPGGPAFTRFIAESYPQHEGLILGAYLSLTEIQKGEHNTDSEERLFKEKLPGVAASRFQDFETRTYLTEYHYRYSGEFHKEINIAMKSEGLVIDTPAAYYVLEYRANTRVYDKYRPAFDHAKKTLRLKA